MTREYFENAYESLKDQRYQGFVKHRLVDVLIVCTLAVMCGFDEPSEIVLFGKERLEFLQARFGIGRIPSESTLTRILNMLDGEAVVSVVIDIMRETLRSDGRQIALDGKTICSTAKGTREKLHILTAYEVERGITLGQLCLSESDKTNEIPTARQLLEIIDIRGKIITADAMRRQLETAAKIVSDGGNYVFGLKGNQPNLLNDVELYIQDCISDKDIQVESASVCGKHGSRGERRTCYVSPTLDWLPQKREWKGLKKAFAIHRVVTEKGLKREEWSY